MTLQDLKIFAEAVWKIIVDDPGAATFVLMVCLAILGGLWKAYTHFFPKSRSNSTTDIEKIIPVLTDQLESATQREQDHLDQIQQLTEAVEALANERDKPDAPAGIDEALSLLAKGETQAAETVFESIKEHRKAEGVAAHKEAAAAARHIGALAYLHDTDKALAVYREAVDLDPDNADAWNQLGRLLYRTGDLDNAEQAYGRVLALGNTLDDKELLAVAFGNLGILYTTRGDLDRAEEMYEKSLEIEESLGHKEGMASDYGNLGTLYSTRGDLDRAEEMYEKSLAIEGALGRKEGMASDYGNLYKIRGDLGRAEEMYEKSLALFREVGAAPQIEQVGEWLADLRRPD